MDTEVRDPALGGDLLGRASDAVAAARRRVAAAQAELAAAAVGYADLRTAEPGCGRRARPGEFVADELSLVLREQAFHVGRLVARTRRVSAQLPTVWESFRAGAVDAEQVRVIDRVARCATEAATLAVIDERAVGAAQSRTPRSLQGWLMTLVVGLEPVAFARRHRRALAERGVRVAQTPDGVGFVTGEVSAEDAAEIDARLTLAARALGADDPRSEQQRRSDIFADLLLERLGLAEADDGPEGSEESDGTDDPEGVGPAEAWTVVEDIDPDTGELLGTHQVRLDADGEVAATRPATPQGRSVPAFTRRPRRVRIGVVVPLASLLGCTATAGVLPDRSGFVPGEVLRQTIADALGSDGQGRDDEVLFTRLLTDDGGRLLDITELGRFASRRLAEAIRLRAGTCRFPSCSVPADRCDIDHHEPVPRGATSAANGDPGCRRHHRGKTHAWQATVRGDDAVTWTMPDAHRYRCVDDPLPTT